MELTPEPKAGTTRAGTGRCRKPASQETTAGTTPLRRPCRLQATGVTTVAVITVAVTTVKGGVESPMAVGTANKRPQCPRLA